MRPNIKILSAVTFLVLAGLLPLAVLAVNENDSGRLSLSSLIEQALKQNPGVAASASAVDAARARVPQAGSLPDPMLTVGAMNLPVDTFKLDQEPMTQLVVGVAQKFPYPGKLDNSSQAADRAGKSSEYRDLALQHETVHQVRAVYHDLVFMDQAISITDRNKELLDALSKIAAAKYSVGMGIQQDVLKAQVELSKIIDDQIGYEQGRAKTAAELNRLVNGGTGRTYPATSPVMKMPALPGRDDLIQAAKTANPMLLAARMNVEQATAGRELAKLSPLPDFTVMMNYGFRRDGEMNGVTQKRPDFVSAAVSVPAPLWKKQKQDQELAEKDAVLRQTQYSEQDLETRIIAQVDKLLADGTRLDRQISLLETGIIPQARQSLQSARAGYVTGKVDFITLLNNQVTLYQLELRLARLKSDYMKVLAALDQLAGKPVEQIMKEVQA